MATLSYLQPSVISAPPAPLVMPVVVCWVRGKEYMALLKQCEQLPFYLVTQANTANIPLWFQAMLSNTSVREFLVVSCVTLHFIKVLMEKAVV